MMLTLQRTLPVPPNIAIRGARLLAAAIVRYPASRSVDPTVGMLGSRLWCHLKTVLSYT